MQLPRLLQKLNRHAEEDTSQRENHNNDNLMSIWEKGQQWCGNEDGKANAAPANWSTDEGSG